VVAAYALVSGGVALVAVDVVSGYLPPDPLVAAGYLAGQSVIVLTLALTLGTRLPGIGAGAVSVGLFGLSWFGGVLKAVAVIFSAESIRPAADLLRVAMPTDLLWRGVIFALEPPVVRVVTSGRSMGGAANPFFADSPPPGEHLVWAIAWLGLVLLAGVLLFRRREL
jgi:MYXO-CTERM domain-containing protein